MSCSESLFRHKVVVPSHVRNLTQPDFVVKIDFDVGHVVGRSELDWSAVFILRVAKFLWEDFIVDRGILNNLDLVVLTKGGETCGLKHPEGSKRLEWLDVRVFIELSRGAHPVLVDISASAGRPDETKQHTIDAHLDVLIFGESDSRINGHVWSVLVAFDAEVLGSLVRVSFQNTVGQISQRGRVNQMKGSLRAEGLRCISFPGHNSLD